MSDIPRLVKGQVRKRGSDGSPSGELGEPQWFVTIEGLLHPVSWARNAGPGFDPQQVEKWPTVAPMVLPELEKIVDDLDYRHGNVVIEFRDLHGWRVALVPPESVAASSEWTLDGDVSENPGTQVSEGRERKGGQNPSNPGGERPPAPGGSGSP